MKSARAMTQNDVEWAVGVLARRRAALVLQAPLYWRPAADALERHRAFLAYVIGEGQGFGFRTDDALMIAAKGPNGWSIDDAWVQPDRWDYEGLDLWTRTVDQVGNEPLRFVCPVFEPERTSFVYHQGLAQATSWWHVAVESLATSGAHETEPRVPGSSATLVPAPPVYDPGGPVLFLQDVQDVAAIVHARQEAARCSAPLVVVDQPVGTDQLARALAEGGFTRHCDFLVGTV